MSFSQLDRITLAAKALAGGVIDGDPVAQWYESTLPFTFVLPADKIWTQATTVKANPAATVTDARNLATGALSGIAQDLSLPANALRLTPVPGVNNTYVALSVYGDLSSPRLENWLAPTFAPQASGLPSFGYAVRLYNGDPASGGTEILTTDGATGSGVNKSVAWLFNYAGGLLLTSSDFSVADPWVVGFRYIGTNASGIAPPSSGGGQSLVYQPGGTASGNVYNDWNLLAAAAAGIQGKTEVIFDDSITPGPFVLPAGNHNFNGATFTRSKASLFTPLDVQLQAGTTLSGLTTIDGPINLINTSTTSSPIVDSSAYYLVVKNGGKLGVVAGASPLIRTVPGSTLVVAFASGGTTSSIVGSEVINADTSSFIVLIALEGGSVPGDVVSSVDATSSMQIRLFSSSSRHIPTYSNFLGTISIDYVSTAAYVGYPPSTTADWSVIPVTTQNALDELAAYNAARTKDAVHLVWQPGGTASGNVYPLLSDIAAAAATATSPVVVYIDNSSAPAGALTVPAGTYSFPSSVTFYRPSGLASLGNLIVNFSSGVVLEGVFRISGPLWFSNASSTSSPISLSSSFNTLELANGAILSVGAGALPFVTVVANNSTFQISIGGISGLQGFDPVLDASGVNSSLVLHMFSGSLVSFGSISGISTARLEYDVYSAASSTPPAAPAFLGTSVVYYKALSSLTGYSPASSATNIWPSGAPIEVKGALDDLASRGLSRVLQVSPLTSGFDLRVGPGDTLDLGGGETLTSQLNLALSPTANDVAFAVYGKQTVIQVNSSPTTITGFAGVPGVTFLLTNTSPTNNLTLAHNNTLSLPANRLMLKGATDRILAPFESVRLYYSINNVWYAVS